MKRKTLIKKRQKKRENRNNFCCITLRELLSKEKLEKREEKKISKSLRRFTPLAESPVQLLDDLDLSFNLTTVTVTGEG